MNQYRSIRLTIAAILLSAAMVATAPGQTLYTSPHGGTLAAITDAIDHAQDHVLIYAYSFTLEPVADSLVAAHRRGCKCVVLADRLQSSTKYSQISRLVRAGVPVYFLLTGGDQHAKTIIIDREQIFLGSYNLSHRAETANLEHTIYLTHPQIAQRLIEEFAKLPTRRLKPYAADAKHLCPTHPSCPGDQPWSK